MISTNKERAQTSATVTVMKHETTRKAITSGYAKVYSVGYCAMDGLLYYTTPTAYNAGVYGWNFDAYGIDYKTVICTGYRNMPGEKIPYGRIAEPNKKAWEIIGNKELCIERKKELINELLKGVLK